MALTRAEQETHFRWDNEAKTLEAWTADRRVAERWRRGGYTVRVLGKTNDGQERTWEVVLPHDGHRRPWIKLFSRAVPRFGPTEDDEKADSISGDVATETSQQDNEGREDTDDQGED